MKFSIWTAVSSERQADNASLPQQQTACLNLANSKGWQDTGLRYVIPGESRTRWVNLRDAENELPPLHEMLEDAKSRRFDILLLYDYNRLRDLLDPVAKTLASYGVQIYSVNQPVEPLPPDDFRESAYASDSESIMRGFSQIISRWQIADLRRKFRYGVSARVRKGLHSTRIPYGYHRPSGMDKTSPAVPIPAQTRVVLQMKALFLQGETYKHIAAILNQSGALTTNGKQWDHSLIKQILLNPFYAGKVFFGRTRTVHDPHHNTTRLIKNPSPLLADGLHQPLFTWDEHLAILAEVERREHLPRNNRYPFSGLLVCSVCSKTLIHDNSYSSPVWHCPGKYHTLLRSDEIIPLVASALRKALRDLDPAGPPPSRPQPDTSTSDLERQRKRIQHAYESELYTLEEAEGKIKTIDAQLKQHQDRHHQLQRQQAKRIQFTSTLKQARSLLEHLPQWLAAEDPIKVNTLLLRLCKQIIVTPDAQLTVVFWD